MFVYMHVMYVLCALCVCMYVMYVCMYGMYDMYGVYVRMRAMFVVQVMYATRANVMYVCGV